MRQLLGWLTCAALFLSGCASAPAPVAEQPFVAPAHPTAHIYLDELFSLEDRLAMGRAVHSWNEALHGVREYDIHVTSMSMSDVQDPSGILILMVDSKCTFIPIVPNHPEDNTLAWTTRGGRVVWVIRDRLEVGWLEGVVRHELGHVFGAPDREGPGLMHYQASIGGFRCIDNTTVGEVEDWMHLAHGTMRGGCR